MWGIYLYLYTNLDQNKKVLPTWCKQAHSNLIIPRNVIFVVKFSDRIITHLCFSLVLSCLTVNDCLDFIFTDFHPLATRVVTIRSCAMLAEQDTLDGTVKSKHETGTGCLNLVCQKKKNCAYSYSFQQFCTGFANQWNVYVNVWDFQYRKDVLCHIVCK